jgi:hypothetical protein
MSALISVQLDAVGQLAAELATLAAGLADESLLCTSTAGSVAAVLGGYEGSLAGSAVSGWTLVVDSLVLRTGGIASTLSSAVEAYRALDAGLAQQSVGQAGVTVIPR